MEPETAAPMAALPAPRTQLDCLPYVDTQYNDPAVRKQVDALVQAELKTFQPADYLATFPSFEPKFQDQPVLEAEWMRVSEEQPMPQMDTSRYQLEPPPPGKQGNAGAWERAVNNARAQLEHQANRLDNLELLQKYGANLWRLHLNSLEAASNRMTKEKEELVTKVMEVNRKRKLEQVDLGPKLSQLEADWVATVKKNLQIEGQVALLQAECQTYRKQLDPTAQ